MALNPSRVAPWPRSKGEKLNKDQIDKFYLDVGEVYAMECGRLGLNPPAAKDNLPPRSELEDGKRRPGRASVSPSNPNP